LIPSLLHKIPSMLSLMLIMLPILLNNSLILLNMPLIVPNTLFIPLSMSPGICYYITKNVTDNIKHAALYILPVLASLPSHWKRLEI
jgi:hypothetical protein